MPDRNGLHLAPGDPVVLFGGSEEEISATVIRQRPGNRYVIQLDPQGPTEDPETRRHRALLDRAYRALGADYQDPFEVQGELLTHAGPG